MIDLDLRRQRISARVKWALGLLAALLISPVIFLVVKGLVGLAIAGIVGLAIINFAPLVAMKFANWKLKGMKAEARENPIETRQNIAMQARQRIRDAETALTTFSTEVRNFTDQVKELSQSQPEDAADFEQQLANLKRLLQLKQEGLVAARAGADAFEKATERAARKWKVAQAAIRMQKLAGAAVDDALTRILAEESLDSVQTAMNQALSELDTAIAMSSAPALPAPTPGVIDINAVEIRERLKA
jgi:hypothetical protein